MKNAIKLAMAVVMLTVSATARAMPEQVPARYYEHRNFLVQIWGDVCGRRFVWWCENVV